jgi:hypothetical protein
MALLIRLLVALAIAVLPVTALARELTAEETAALTQRVADFDAAMRANDLATVAKAIPPQIITHIATSAGMTDEALLAEMIKQMSAAMANVKIVDFSMDVPNAEQRELADGTPYVLIPTETTLDLGADAGGKILAKSPTLGLLKDDVWYLRRIADEGQITLLVGAFPEFAGVEFPPGTMEPIAE